MTAAALAERTSDAYSVPAYASWNACAATLLRRGFSTIESEAILRSKWMRWAADASTARYGRATSRDLDRFLDEMTPDALAYEVADLVRWTFGSDEA